MSQASTGRHQRLLSVWSICICRVFAGPLRKHTYINILNILSSKNENIHEKKTKHLIFFHISAQNIDCGYSLELSRRGGSNEYPQSMFLSRNKTNIVYPCKPQFYDIKVGFKGGSKLYKHNFPMYQAHFLKLRPVCVAMFIILGNIPSFKI